MSPDTVPNPGPARPKTYLPILVCALAWLAAWPAEASKKQEQLQIVRR